MPLLPFSELKNFEVDHLLLPVGFNPLPNAVSGPLLVRDSGRITLLHTGPPDKGGTSEIAGNYLKPILEHRLARRNVTITTHHTPMDESRISSIRKEVYCALDSYTDAGSVGLHYTAGTKAMSAHAHRFVKAWASRNNKPHPRLSYLSARELAIFIDPETDDGEETEVSIGASDPAAPQVSLEEMLHMHGGTLSRTPTGAMMVPSTQPEMVLAAAAIAKINWRAGTPLFKQWTDVKKDKDGRLADQGWKGPIASDYDRVTKWKKDGYGRQESVADHDFRVEQELSSLDPISLVGCPPAVAEEFRSSLRLPASATEIVPAASVAAGHIDSVTAFYAFIHGTWLESYAMWAMEQASDELIAGGQLGLHDLYRQLVSSFAPMGPRKFEVDVVGIRGYQLFGISCAIETRINEGEGRAKWKLFEAITRARQLGGDEARVAFVSLLNATDARAVVSEAAGLLQFQGRVKAFGRSDLEKLSEKFKDWITFA